MSARQTAVPWTTEKPPRPWTTPDARLVCAADVDRETWLRERRDLVGGSDVAKLYDVSKYGDAYTVWLEKTGRVADGVTSTAQYRGSVFEEPVVDLWAARYAEFPIEYRRQGLLRSRRYRHAGATLDRISICPLGRCVIEVKTAVDLSEWDDDEVPTAVQFQGQWQLGVSGRNHVHYLVVDGRFYPHHRIMFRDDALIDAMFVKVGNFWNEHVEPDVAPAPTERAADAVKSLFGNPNRGETYVVDDEEAEVLRTLPALKLAAEDAKRDYERALVGLQASIGNATEIFYDELDEKPAATWRPTRVIDGCTKDFRRENPDLVGPFEYVKETVEVDVDKLAENYPELLANGVLRYRRSWLLK